MDLPRTGRRRSPVPRAAIVVGVTVLIAVGAGSMRRLRSAEPTVDRATLWIDTVQRGDMLRQVRASGALEVEQMRLVTAPAPARLESIAVRPGARVSSDTVLMRLVNHDLELQALEADRQLAAAQADLVNLEATLRAQSLGQQSSIATLRADLRQSEQRAKADSELARHGYLSQLEMDQSNERARSLAGSVEFEQARLHALNRGERARLTAQRAQVERLRAIARFRHDEVDALVVRAGIDGVLQELALQPGQWVPAGTTLAKVARPDSLKASLRVPETQAREIQVGQAATIDTHNGQVQGKVARIDPAVRAGSVVVDVVLTAPLPQGARPDLSVEGTIDLERLRDVVHIHRPALAQASGEVPLFRVSPDGAVATRIGARLGRSSFGSVEVLDGLAAGDRVILSDLSAWDGVERLRLR